MNFAVVAALGIVPCVTTAFCTPTATDFRRPVVYHQQSLKATLLHSETTADYETNPLQEEDSNNDESLLAASRRQTLKKEILRLADEYQQMKNEADEARLKQVEDQKRKDTLEEMRDGYVQKLLSRIMKKVMRRKRSAQAPEKIIRRDSLGTSKLDTGLKGREIIALAEDLARLNPTKVPVFGWKGYDGGDPFKDCKLNGTWKLRFTTAADATFPESPTRGKARTSQEIDAKAGTLTNVVDFERGKLKGFRVVVAGKATADNEIDLRFRRVVVLRHSRFPRLFGRLVIPIPARLLRFINRIFAGKENSQTNRRGPFFQIQYIDDDFRMHKTGEGNWFIQSRLYPKT